MVDHTLDLEFCIRQDEHCPEDNQLVTHERRWEFQEDHNWPASRSVQQGFRQDRRSGIVQEDIADEPLRAGDTAGNSCVRYEAAELCQQRAVL